MVRVGKKNIELKKTRQWIQTYLIARIDNVPDGRRGICDLIHRHDIILESGGGNASAEQWSKDKRRSPVTCPRKETQFMVAIPSHCIKAVVIVT